METLYELVLKDLINQIYEACEPILPELCLLACIVIFFYARRKNKKVKKWANKKFKNIGEMIVELQKSVNKRPVAEDCHRIIDTKFESCEAKIGQQFTILESKLLNENKQGNALDTSNQRNASINNSSISCIYNNYNNN